MIITCKNCHASYNLDESLLDPTGSRVRCTNCGHVFVAYPPPTITVPDDDIDEGVDVTDAEVDETWESPAPETTEFDFE
ncbi:MAG: zinc-ribbon domain-containing protein, partial [Desulfosarcinaceae bacterium]